MAPAPLRGPGIALVVVAVLAWVAFFGPALHQHWLRSSVHWLFNDDVRIQIWPMFRFVDPNLFNGDYLADYQLRAFLPFGYRSLYRLLAPWWDPAAVSKALPYILFPLSAFLTALAARHVAGVPGFFVAGAFCLSSEYVFSSLVGGLPRAFGYPVAACAVYGIASGRMGVLAFAVLAGAALYPAAAVAPGVAFALVCLLLPACSRGGVAQWSLSRRLSVVAAVATAALLLVLPSLIGAREYGGLILSADVAHYPELGPQGRYNAWSRAPFPEFFGHVVQVAFLALRGRGAALFPDLAALVPARTEQSVLAWILLALALAGPLARRKAPAMQRLWALAAALAAVYFVSCRVSPYLYLPTRHVTYLVPLLFSVLLPGGAAALAAVVADRRRRLLVPGCVLGIGAVMLLFFGARQPPRAGLIAASSEDKPLYQFLAALPSGSLVAGMPGGAVENVPYLSRRPVFYSFELHQVFHVRYAEEMRRRMRLLGAAYYAADPGPLRRLRQEYKVTHLIVNLALFRKPPSYFAPFTPEEDFTAGQAKGFFLPGVLEKTGVFRSGDVAVLDMSKL